MNIDKAILKSKSPSCGKGKIYDGTFSGGMIAALGFSLIAFLNNSDKIPVTLSPIFVACFTFCFAFFHILYYLQK